MVWEYDYGVVGVGIEYSTRGIGKISPGVPFHVDSRLLDS